MMAPALALLLAATTTDTSGALTLPAAVEGALERSPDLEAALLGLETAALAPERLDAAWSWNAFAEGGVNQDELPRRSPFESEYVTTVPVAAGASRLFPTGTFVEVRTDASWFDAPLPALFESFGAFPGGGSAPTPVTSGWTQGTTITARHPIWGTSQPELIELQRQQIRADVAAGGARVAEGLDAVLGEVHRRFWGQALAQEALQVADEGVKAAEEIRELVDRKRRRGFADDRDTLRATAATQQAIDQRIASERALDQARRALLDRVGAAEGSFSRVQYDLAREVADEPVASIVARAEAASLALRSLASARRAQQTALALAEAEQRTSLSAVGRLGEQVLLPDGGLDDFEWKDNTGVAAFVGVRWEGRFGDSDARTRARQAAIEMRRLDAEAEVVRKRIRVAAAESVAAVASTRERIANAAKLVETQERRYAEEQQNFAIGRSQLRDVIEARQSLTTARFSLAAARVALQSAAAERDLLTGRLTTPWRERLAERRPAYRAVSGDTP